MSAQWKEQMKHNKLSRSCAQASLTSDFDGCCVPFGALLGSRRGSRIASDLCFRVRPKFLNSPPFPLAAGFELCPCLVALAGCDPLSQAHLAWLQLGPLEYEPSNCSSSRAT